MNQHIKAVVRKKDPLKIISLLLQGIFCLFCVIDIILCFVLQNNYGSAIEQPCAFIVINLTCILVLIPALPASLALNICASLKKRNKSPHRTGWLIWTIFSPVIYIVFTIAALVILVSTTGGV